MSSVLRVCVIGEGTFRGEALGKVSVLGITLIRGPSLRGHPGLDLILSASILCHEASPGRRPAMQTYEGSTPGEAEKVLASNSMLSGNSKKAGMAEAEGTR